jgi:hypothetical protein
LSGLLLAGTALCSAVALSAAGGIAIGTYVPAGQIAAVDLTPAKTAASNTLCLGGPTAVDCTIAEQNRQAALGLSIASDPAGGVFPGGVPPWRSAG